MKNLKIAISGYGSISSLGTSSESIWKKYLDNQHCFNKEKITSKEEWVADLSLESKETISVLIKEKKYQQLENIIAIIVICSSISVKIYPNVSEKIGEIEVVKVKNVYIVEEKNLIYLIKSQLSASTRTSHS
jgi:hypothetical protein